MISKKFIGGLKRKHEEHCVERKQIIALANVVLHESKRVIFSLHRDDVKKAENSLKEIEKTLRKLEKKFGYRRLCQEGSYKAGVEEYVEAKSLFLVLDGVKIEKFKDIRIGFDSYLGGICDLTGELVRRAVNQAAAGNIEEVEKMKRIISDILAELVEFDMTGYLRTKYDQARGNLRKIEQINYETTIRR